jgi:hypothetical protein
MMDQAVAPDKRLWEYELTEVEAAVYDAVEAKDDHFITDLMGTKIKTIRIQGVAMAKLLSLWKDAAPEFGLDADDWIDHAAAWTGLASGTIYKYVDVWRSVLAPWENTDRFWVLVSKPIQGLLLLPAAAKEGSLQENDWEEIEGAEDGLAIKKVVKRVRGEATNSKTAINLVVGRDGLVTAWRGDESAAVGYLNIHDTDQLTDAAVTRILNAAGIRRE